MQMVTGEPHVELRTKTNDDVHNCMQIHFSLMKNGPRFVSKVLPMCRQPRFLKFQSLRFFHVSVRVSVDVYSHH
jgi:hypothetical protein